MQHVTCHLQHPATAYCYTDVCSERKYLYKLRERSGHGSSVANKVLSLYKNVCYHTVYSLNIIHRLSSSLFPINFTSTGKISSANLSITNYLSLIYLLGFIFLYVLFFFVLFRLLSCLYRLYDTNKCTNILLIFNYAKNQILFMEKVISIKHTE